MPPVMGAVAFIMAETLGCLTRKSQGRVIPAMLITHRLWMVHLSRRRSAGLPRHGVHCVRSRKAGISAAARGAGVDVVPRFHPLFAGMTGLALTALILGAPSRPLLDRFFLM
jgi:TRAP-type uncharacterized transport system fused permease subunit